MYSFLNSFHSLSTLKFKKKDKKKKSYTDELSALLMLMPTSPALVSSLSKIDQNKAGHWNDASWVDLYCQLHISLKLDLQTCFACLTLSATLNISNTTFSPLCCCVYVCCQAQHLVHQLFQESVMEIILHQVPIGGSL